MNGPPVAINARPSVQAIRSAGVASAAKRTGKREDDGPLGMRGHVPDDRFRESAGYRRRADQHGRPHPANHLGQADMPFQRRRASRPLTSAAGRA